MSSRSETGLEPPAPSPVCVSEVQRHVASCAECSRKVREYSLLLNRLSVGSARPALPGTGCPQDVDWYEVAAGQWPELLATQLIMHAAGCDHCGPLLSAATRMEYDPTAQEEKLLEELRTPSRPDSNPPKKGCLPLWPSLRWLAPALVLLVIVGVLTTKPSSSPAPLSGPDFAEFAVRTHRQHAQGELALDIYSESQQALNEWLKAKSPFSLVLPASPAAPGDERLYRPEGARLVRIGGKNAAFMAYRAQTPKLQTSQIQIDPVSLIVIPDSVSVATGGVEVTFTKVSFHYATVDGYKVVTWSLHGLTYALVSQEDNSTQRSCMVCHSAMGDRDLSQTQTPLRSETNAIRPIWQ